MKKKILFIMGSLGGGGAEKVLITLLHFFDYTRYDVDLCLLNRVGVYLKDIPTPVKVISLYESPHLLRAKIDHNCYSRLGVEFFERMRIRNKVESSYDAIVSFCEGRALKFHSYITDHSRHNITWVHTDMEKQDYTSGQGFRAKHEKRAYAAMETIVFVSEDAKRAFGRYAIRWGGVPQAYQTVVFNPINKSFIGQFKKDRISENQPSQIVMVCGLRPQKGFDKAVRLAYRLKKESIDFCIRIVGEGDCRRELEQQIADLDVADRVKLVGFRNPPYAEMASADFFLSTSLTEGMPLVQLEAMCLGLPVVATRCTGPAELLGESKYGLLVEQDDESIYHGVVRMLSDSTLRKHYAQAGEERLRDFDTERIIYQIYDLLNKD